MPVPSVKRKLTATSEIDPLPAKRAQLSRTDARGPEVGDEKKQKRRPKSLSRRHYNSLSPSRLSVHKPRSSNSSSTSPTEILAQSLSKPLFPIGLSPSGRPEEHSRSDIHLHHSDGVPISGKLTKSALEIGNMRDTDKFVVLPAPASTGSRSYWAATASVTPSDLTTATPDSGRSSARSPIKEPFYRDANLAENNVYMRNPDEEFPEYIASLACNVGKNRDSPGPSPDELSYNEDFCGLESGAGEPEVKDYFKDEIFPKSKAFGILKRTDLQPMAKHTVLSTGSKLKLSTPVPGILYGYNRHGAFTTAQQAKLNSVGNKMAVNNQSLIYQFFVIELKGDGGSFCVATNQCLEGSASFINVAEHLNYQLRQCKSSKVQPLKSATFSITMYGTEARIYVSWKYNELDSYVQKIERFLLQRPEHYLDFHKHVRNIIDGEKGRRLNEIRVSLNILLEESRKRASEAASSCQPPSNGPVTIRSKRLKPSSRRDSSKSDGVQRQSGGEDKPYADGTVTLVEHD